MNSPSDLLAHPDVVVPELVAENAADAIATLHARLSHATSDVTDPGGFLAALRERARLAPVAIAPDVAVPHARTDAVKRLVLALGRSTAGIPFDADHQQVRLVFLIGPPRDQVGEYLQIVAAIARLLRNGALRTAMLAAGDEDELRALLTRTIKVAV